MSCHQLKIKFLWSKLKNIPTKIFVLVWKRSKLKNIPTKVSILVWKQKKKETDFHVLHRERIRNGPNL